LGLYAVNRSANCRNNAGNPMFANLRQPGLGTFPVPSTPVSFSEAFRTGPKVAPALGVNTEEILGDVVGLPDVEIAQFFDDGVVQSPAFCAALPEA
jgi:2-methylfumaryl-CoA isomerase